MMTQANQKSPTISLCMIVKNEERDLPRCLRSAAPWVQEIIVVDTGSTDKTVEVARSFGARVEHFTWCDDFAAARNAALQHATGDWILCLDADEELDPTTAPNLPRVVAVPIPRPRVYALLIRSLDDSKDSMAYHSGYVTRLFVNHPRVRWHRPIHEQVVHLDDPQGLDIVFCDQVVVLHYGYLQAARREGDKAARNQRILAQAVTHSPDDPYVHFHLGLEHYKAGRYREAETSFLEAIALTRGRPLPGYIAAVYSLLVATYLALAEYESAITRGREGIRLFEFADLYCNLATTYLRRQEYDEAFPLFQRARALHGQRHIFPTDETATTSLPLQGMGDIHLLRGDVARASECYTEALRFSPNSPTLHKRAAQALISRQRWAEAEDHLRQALALQPDDVLAMKQLSECLTAQDRVQEAYDFLDAKVAAAPEHVAFRLLLGNFLHAQGESDAAVDVLIAGASGAGEQAPLYYRLSQILSEMGRQEDATNAATIAQQLDPLATAALAVQEADDILRRFAR